MKKRGLQWTESRMGYFERAKGYRYRVVNVVTGADDEQARLLLEKLSKESGRSSVQTIVALAELLRQRSDGGGAAVSESPFLDDEFEVAMSDETGVYVLSFELEEKRFARLTEIVDDDGNSL